MLQALLVDRFQLRFHRETRPGTVHLLEKSGKPITLRPTGDGEQHVKSMGDAGFSGNVGFAGGKWAIYNTTMPQLARWTADYILHAPVADRTNLPGAFDYRQPTALPESEANYSDNTDSFLRLISEVGLKLENTKGPVEILVIDHAQKPSPN